MSSHSDDASGDAPDAMSQIARLRAQVEALMREKVGPVAAQMAAGTEHVEEMAHEAADAMRGQAEALAIVVRERPLTAILIAGVIGYLIGRVAR